MTQGTFIQCLAANVYNYFKKYLGFCGENLPTYVGIDELGNNIFSCDILLVIHQTNTDSYFKNKHSTFEYLVELLVQF